jgi:2-(3-amino-3-carboxypropyl)histidine synthase
MNVGLYLVFDLRSAPFRYDPYNQKFTIEKYDTPQMFSIRQAAIEQARTAKKFGLILGTLGRQGSTHIMDRLETLFRSRDIPFVVVCLSEIMPAKLALFNDVDAYVLKTPDFS